MRQISRVMGPHQRNIGAKSGGQAPRLAQGFEVQRDRDAAAGGAALDLVQIAGALEPDQGGQVPDRQAKTATDSDDGGHPQRFAHAGQIGKRDVRHDRTDKAVKCSHIPDMAAKPRKARHDLYEPYRARSGWYLAAWRDHAGLTLEDLAAELSVSKGYVSDLETGATRENRPPTRFNRDLVERAALAVGTTGGRLIDLNPFTLNEQTQRLTEVVSRLDPDGQAAVLEMAERWAARTGTSG